MLRVKTFNTVCRYFFAVGTDVLWIKRILLDN